MSGKPVALIVTQDLFGDDGQRILQYADGSINLFDGAELFPLDDDQVAVLKKMIARVPGPQSRRNAR